MAHMRRVRSMACVLVAITLMVTLLTGSAFAATGDKRRKIVMLDNPLTPQVFDLLAAAGIRVLYNLSLINGLAVELPALAILVEPALELLDDLGEVYDDLLTLVDPICPTPVPPGAIEHYPWGQVQIGVNQEEVHPEWQGSGVKVAILDTGIVSHLEFGWRIARGYNVINEGYSPFDNHGHGTHLAGIIAADLGNNLSWIIGAAPRATLVPVKVLNDSGAGYLADVIKGLEWVSKNGIRLVNMSFGFSFSNPGDDKPLEQAIQALDRAGIIMVASAGNCAGAQDDGGGDDCKAPACDVTSKAITAPAIYQKVIAVGATDIVGDITDYSQWRPKLDVLAPGGTLDDQILSTNNKGPTFPYGLGHGTSQAAAHVTGAVALALEVDSSLTPKCVRALLNPTGVAELINVPTLIRKLVGGAQCPSADTDE